MSVDRCWEDLLEDRFSAGGREASGDETPHLLKFSKLEAVSDIFCDEELRSR